MEQKLIETPEYLDERIRIANDSINNIDNLRYDANPKNIKLPIYFTMGNNSNEQYNQPVRSPPTLFGKTFLKPENSNNQQYSNTDKPSLEELKEYETAKQLNELLKNSKSYKPKEENLDKPYWEFKGYNSMEEYVNDKIIPKLVEKISSYFKKQIKDYKVKNNYNEEKSTLSPETHMLPSPKNLPMLPPPTYTTQLNPPKNPMLSNLYEISYSDIEEVRQYYKN